MQLKLQQMAETILIDKQQIISPLINQLSVDSNLSRTHTVELMNLLGMIRVTVLSVLMVAFCSISYAQDLLPEPLNEQQRRQLSARAMDSSLTQAQRLIAITRLYPDLINNRDQSINVCVWDVMGRSGPIFIAAQDQQMQLQQYGIVTTMKAYTNESVMVEDLKAGQCDAALMTGLRARSFNKYAGTIDSIGALPTIKHLKLLLKVLSHPRSANRMVEGPYVVMGFNPIGAAYIFVNDKSISTLAKAAGKKVAVMDYDIVQAEMVQSLGATPVPTSLISAGPKFNNRIVDVLPAPLIAYDIMELYKGIGETGGIVRFPFSQLTLQLIGRTDRIPNEVAQLIREEFYKNFDQIYQISVQQTPKIPDDLWIEISKDEQEEYHQMMQLARIQLRDRDYYDADMLTLQRKVRCKLNPQHFECAKPTE